jgi:hypothetical protein
MSAVPTDWEEAHLDCQIAKTIPLFLKTHAGHYAKMDGPFCRNKIDNTCMWLWRYTVNIDWDDPTDVEKNGVALSFWLWRPRYKNGDPIEDRYTACVFLGTDVVVDTDLVDKIEATVKAFADQLDVRDVFYIVKQARFTYPPLVQAVFEEVERRNRLAPRYDAPAEYGWKERKVWKVKNWP